MKPLGTKIYIAETKAERKTASGIILEGATSIRETKFATVLEIGDKVENIKVGDSIVLDWSKCYPVKVGDFERAIIDVEHVLAIND
jgi:chaperonin GroES